MYKRGVDDLIKLLTCVGKVELITPENIQQIEFYTRALVNTLVEVMGNRNGLYDWLMVQDKTQYISRILYDALTAESIK